jgi:hypothetical protein
MSELIRHRRALSSTAAVIGGVWLLSHLPGVVLAMLLFVALTAAYEARTGRLGFGCRGAKLVPVVESPGQLPSAQSSTATTGARVVMTSTSAGAEGSTVEALTADLWDTRLLLAAERELTALLVGELSPEHIIGENESER